MCVCLYTDLCKLCALVCMLNYGVCLFVWSDFIFYFFSLPAFTQIFVVPRSCNLLPPRIWVTLQHPPRFQCHTHPPLQPCPLLESQEDPVCQVIHVNQRYIHAEPEVYVIFMIGQNGMALILCRTWVRVRDNKPFTLPWFLLYFPEVFAEPIQPIMRANMKCCSSYFLNSETF